MQSCTVLPLSLRTAPTSLPLCLSHTVFSAHHTNLELILQSWKSHDNLTPLCKPHSPNSPKALKDRWPEVLEFPSPPTSFCAYFPDHSPNCHGCFTNFGNVLKLTESNSHLGLLASLPLPSFSIFVITKTNLPKLHFNLEAKRKSRSHKFICIILKLPGSFKSITGSIFL